MSLRSLLPLCLSLFAACASATSENKPDAQASGTTDASLISADAFPGAADARPGDADAMVSAPDAPPTGAVQLVFSEYIEGSSNNKALEIYNRGTTTVALSRCSVARYNNGGTGANQTQALNMLTPIGGGTAPTMLAAKAVLVIADPAANATIDAAADGSSGITAYNGNDALELTCDGVVVDSFGQVGNDPGTEWNNGGVGTEDVTLRRACSATGDTQSTDTFDPSAEWTQLSLDDFSGLGTHTCP